MNNYNKHPNGKIWIMWDISSITMKIIDCFDQFIHGEVYNLEVKIMHWLSIIYAYNQIVNRKKLWMYIKDCARTIQGPWMIIGDYKNVLRVEDIIGGNMVQDIEYVDLECMMERLELNEHDTIGNHYTWSNKHSNGLIYSRIDKALRNKE